MFTLLLIEATDLPPNEFATPDLRCIINSVIFLGINLCPYPIRGWRACIHSYCSVDANIDPSHPELCRRCAPLSGAYKLPDVILPSFEKNFSANREICLRALDNGENAEEMKFFPKMAMNHYAKTFPNENKL